jgi:hypothetical protein
MDHLVTDQRRHIAQAACALTIAGACLVPFASAQTSRKPTRVERPVFESGQFDDVFFADAKGLLKGEMPRTQASRLAPTRSPTSSSGEATASPTEAKDALAWSTLVSPASLEDLIKGGKLRLDRIITTPAAFKGGGFVAARKEFSLQALLFAIIETYPGEVRWKSSAPQARELFTRVAANTKIGSDQVYQEAKKRMLDLTDLIGGSPLGGEAKSETDWSNLVDRVPLMQLLEFAYEENLKKQTASKSQFEDDPAAVQRYAELVAVLGKLTLAEEMPDANDEDYQSFAKEMIAESQRIVLAVKTNNADLARQAAGQIGQSCTRCHENFQ